MSDYNQEYWGEMPVAENPTDIDDKVNVDTKSLGVRGATLYQCTANTDIKQEGEEWFCDPLVLHSIRLLAHARQMRDLIQNAQILLDAKRQADRKELSNTALLTAPPSLPAPLSSYPAPPSMKSETWKTPSAVTATTARTVLRRVVAIMVAHMGYDTANEGALTVLTDVLHEFLVKITRLLRGAVERDEISGFPDILERVVCDCGMGSIRNLGQWYETRVKKNHTHTVKTVHNLHEKYEQMYTSEQSTIAPSKRFFVDNDLENLLSVPELHVSSLEGRSQQMEMGLHVLHSLEGGDNVLMNDDSLLSNLLDGS